MLHNIDGPQQIKRPRHLRSPTSAVSNAAPPVVSREAIEQAVIQVFGVGPADLHHTTRGRAKVAQARQVAMYLASRGVRSLPHRHRPTVRPRQDDSGACLHRC